MKNQFIQRYGKRLFQILNMLIIGLFCITRQNILVRKMGAKLFLAPDIRVPKNQVFVHFGGEKVRNQKKFFSFMLTPFPFVSNPVIFGPRKWEFVSLCTEDCLKGWNHFSNPWCGITFPTPGVGNTFPSLGRKQYQSDSTPGMEKLLHFSILSPQISILPWLGLHKAWNL